MKTKRESGQGMTQAYRQRYELVAGCYDEIYQQYRKAAELELNNDGK